MSRHIRIAGSRRPAEIAKILCVRVLRPGHTSIGTIVAVFSSGVKRHRMTAGEPPGPAAEPVILTRPGANHSHFRGPAGRCLLDALAERAQMSAETRNAVPRCSRPWQHPSRPPRPRECQFDLSGLQQQFEQLPRMVNDPSSTIFD